MAAWQETELKLGLPDEAAWRWVRERLGPGPTVSQTNHFFDTPDRRLREARIGVRVREQAGRVTLTAKGPAMAAGDATHPVTRRVELETPLDPEALTRIRAEGLDVGPHLARWRHALADTAEPGPRLFLDRLAAAASEPLARFGSFTNERRMGRLALAEGEETRVVDVELDRTHYPGDRTDFEIEIEAGQQGVDEEDLAWIHRVLVDWLVREGGIQPFAAESKLARLEALLEAGESSGR